MRKVDRILVIDDDAELCGLVGEYLEPEGFQIEAVHNGNHGLERALNGDHLLVVLDVMLPGMNGFDCLRRMRDTSRIPVLLLTARGEDVDRIVGLEIGADDYLPKPFNPRELVARIRAILRRTQGRGKAEERASTSPKSCGWVTSNLIPQPEPSARMAHPVDLTSVEFNLLHVLLREAGRVVTREHLVDTVLSRKFSPFDRSIDMHVSKVRKKLGDSENGSRPHQNRARRRLYFRPPARAAASKATERGSMKSLFCRIFLSYWMAQALFMVLAIMIVTALRPSREDCELAV